MALPDRMPADMPATLDVLMPHYRDPAGLALSLASIEAQVWAGRMRVVVVDDGSPPAEAEAARRLCDDTAARAGLAVTFLRNPENLGRPRTRNRLLDAVEAEYVAWLDAGDIWYPDKLARQFAHLARLRWQGEDVDRLWISCHYDWHQGGRIRLVRQQVTGDLTRELLLGAHLRAYLWTLLGTARARPPEGRDSFAQVDLLARTLVENFGRGGGGGPGRAGPPAGRSGLRHRPAARCCGRGPRRLRAGRADGAQPGRPGAGRRSGSAPGRARAGRRRSRSWRRAPRRLTWPAMSLCPGMWTSRWPGSRGAIFSPPPCRRG